MPKSRTRRKNRDGATRSPSARSQARQFAAMMAPLEGVEIGEAEGYLLDAIAAKTAYVDSELGRVRAILADVPRPAPLNSAAFVEANALDDEITHLTDIRGELDTWAERVRNRIAGDVPGSLGMLTIRAASNALLEEAHRLGTEVDADAYAEAKRREHLVSRWLMNHSGETEVVPELGHALAMRREVPPARP